MAAGLLCMLGSTLTSLAQPALFGRVLDALASGSGDDGSVLQSLIVQLVVISVVESVLTFGKTLLFGAAGERVVARLRRRVFHSIVANEIGFFDRVRSGELVSRLTGDISVLREAATSHVSTALKSLAIIVGGLAYLFSVSWRLTLVMLAIVPAVAVAARFYGRFTKTLAKDVRHALAEASATAEETIGNIRTVRSFAMEARQEGAFGEKVETTLRLGIRASMASAAFAATTEAVTLLAFIVLLYYGGGLVLQGGLSAGALTSFLLYAVRLGAAIAGLAGLFGNVMSAVGATDRVFKLLDRIPCVPTAEGEEVEAVNGSIAFRDVTFAYPSRPTSHILSRMSMEVPAGTTAALVGPSGAGKSTIIALIERFYDPEDDGVGSVTVDGRDLRGLNGSSLRRHIGLVLQEPVLFAASIRENIAFGKPEATDDEIVAAAKHANAHEFISAFPGGYDTQVGERGVRLSGGQKQRVAIARAILQDPRILLLDEATSALDAESEHAVKKALDALMVGRTTIIVAHRLSTVRQAHSVFVLHKGKVAAKGTHEELLKSSGLYARLVRRQLMNAESMRGGAVISGGAAGAGGGGRVGAGAGAGAGAGDGAVMTALEAEALANLPAVGEDELEKELDGVELQQKHGDDDEEEEEDAAGARRRREGEGKGVKGEKGAKKGKGATTPAAGSGSVGDTAIDIPETATLLGGGV
jgi:ABC-type multidrug transport system fused ATPase/permease subunit